MSDKLTVGTPVLVQQTGGWNRGEISQVSGEEQRCRIRLGDTGDEIDARWAFHGPADLTLVVNRERCKPWWKRFAAWVRQ